MARLLVRSYMYNSKKTSGNQYKSNTLKEQEKQIRLRNNAIKARNDYEKAKYKLDQMKLAESMTIDIQDKYKQYFEISQNEYSNRDIFDLRDLKRVYQKTDFIYDKQKPLMNNPVIEQAVLLKVPKKTFFEKIFHSLENKRISIIKENEQRIQCVADKNKQHEIDELERYNKLKLQYETKMEEARIIWEQSEQKIEFEILEENKSIDNWIAACDNDDDDAIMNFIETLFDVKNYGDDFLIDNKVLYNKESHKVIIDLHIKNRDEIFYTDFYTYMPRNKEIRAVKMKVSTANEMLKKLLIELIIHTFILFFNNSFSKKFNTVTVNVYSGNICCASSSINMCSYNTYNLSIIEEKDKFISTHINLFNKLANGVVAIETLFIPIKEKI
ncbi:MAG: hypothetical protein R3Y35_12420 [Clostridia bacterium]